MAKNCARMLPKSTDATPVNPVIGVFAACDPRIDEDSRKRACNIVKMTADSLADAVKLPNGSTVEVVWTPILVDGEKQADIVARQFKNSGVNILVAALDTWAFPQLSLISLLQQFPKETPINLTCGNSGPKPGVVFVHACSGAISQYGKLVHINVGSWPDTGLNPKMSKETGTALVDWCYGALTAVGLRGKRVVIFGHDSMGMETALGHIIPTRNTFGLEITRLDMKLLADMLSKSSYSKQELKGLRAWIDKQVGKRLEIKSELDSKRFDQSLAMYLIVRDLMAELNAIGGGFMSQLEWGSDKRGKPLPVADIMESLFNSTFDHNGSKEPLPYATEADVQGLLTMLPFTWLTAGNPPLFMDFRKVWEAPEIKALAKKLKVKLTGKTLWEKHGFVDGDNSGSASFNWAAKPGAGIEKIMQGVRMPLADQNYFPGMGNSVTFISPEGIDGIAGRLTYSALNNKFSLIWDEATTISMPDKLAKAVTNISTPTWPHTFVVPKYATMGEYKQFAPANHFHMTWGLTPARLEYWLDLTGVISATPWQKRPDYVEGLDRPTPLLHIINGGEYNSKMLQS